MNSCTFSTDRNYRYSLQHDWDELYPRKTIIWIGLNPSTADEQKLDPTLRRIRRFSGDWGYTRFIMLNLMSYRATKPKVLTKLEDPFGPAHVENIRSTLRQHPNAPVVAAWGAQGGLLNAETLMLGILKRGKRDPKCLGHTSSGKPCHPLYIPGNRTLRDLDTYTLEDVRPILDQTDLNAIHRYAEDHAERMTIEVAELRINQTKGAYKKALQKILKHVKSREGAHIDLREKEPVYA